MKRTKFLLRFAVMTLAALLLVISCAAFSACGYNELARKNKELKDEVARLQSEVDYLSSSERLLELQSKLDNIISTDWDDEYSYGTVFVYICPGHENKVYGKDDFPGIGVTGVKPLFDFYVVDFESSGIKDLISAVMHLYSFDFVENVVLNYQMSGD